MGFFASLRCLSQTARSVWGSTCSIFCPLAILWLEDHLNTCQQEWQFGSDSWQSRSFWWYQIGCQWKWWQPWMSPSPWPDLPIFGGITYCLGIIGSNNCKYDSRIIGVVLLVCSSWKDVLWGCRKTAKKDSTVATTQSKEIRHSWCVATGKWSDIPNSVCIMSDGGRKAMLYSQSAWKKGKRVVIAEWCYKG